VIGACSHASPGNRDLACPVGEGWPCCSKPPAIEELSIRLPSPTPRTPSRSQRDSCRACLFDLPGSAYRMPRRHRKVHGRTGLQRAFRTVVACPHGKPLLLPWTADRGTDVPLCLNGSNSVSGASPAVIGHAAAYTSSPLASTAVTRSSNGPVRSCSATMTSRSSRRRW
jgi:hypothetical protein